MKRSLPTLLVTIAMFFCMVLPASAIDLVVDSKKIELDVAPTVINQRTLVPLRAIFEELGATVEWDQATMTATATKGNDVVKITIDSTTAYHNDTPVTLDVAATAINGRTLVPVRFVSEELNAKVYWLQETQTVRVATQLYEVVRVVDGDTIVVNFNGAEERVRMIGVDTPESVHPDASKNTESGAVASAYTTTLLSSKQVELEFDTQQRDQYGRLLAYVYLDGAMVNKSLLKEGYANLSTFPPNIKYVDDFTEIVSARDHTGTSQGETAPVKTSGTYIGSLDSDKYHSPTCRWAKKILPENAIWFDTAAEAQAAEYQSCGVCKP